MKNALFSLLLFTFLAIVTTPVAVLAADKTYSSDTTLKADTALDHCVVGEGVTLNLNGKKLEIKKSLTVKKNGKITGGMILFDKDSSCEGLPIYYMLNYKYRKFPLSIKEFSATFKHGFRPEFKYVKELDGYCLDGNRTGDPFGENPADDITYTSNAKHKQNGPYESFVVGEGVTLDLNGCRIEIREALQVKKGGKITGNGSIAFDKDSTCEGITLYYQLDGKYRKLPISIKELTADLEGGYKPQFDYVKELDAYCLTGNRTGNPFNEDFNKEKADKILADLGKPKVSAVLCDVDKITVTWNKFSQGKDYTLRYKLLYRNVTANEEYQELMVIEDGNETSLVTEKLKPSTKYTFKLIPEIEYFNNIYEGKAVFSTMYTLGVPKIKTISGVKGKPTYANVTWGNIKGEQEDGYEVCITRDKEGKNLVKIVDVPKKTAKSKQIKLNYGTFYFTVRAYKFIGDEKITTDWSKQVKYEIKKQ